MKDKNDLHVTKTKKHFGLKTKTMTTSKIAAKMNTGVNLMLLFLI